MTILQNKQREKKSFVHNDAHLSFSIFYFLTLPMWHIVPLRWHLLLLIASNIPAFLLANQFNKTPMLLLGYYNGYLSHYANHVFLGPYDSVGLIGLLLLAWLKVCKIRFVIGNFRWTKVKGIQKWKKNMYVRPFVCLHDNSKNSEPIATKLSGQLLDAKNKKAFEEQPNFFRKLSRKLGKCG